MARVSEKPGRYQRSSSGLIGAMIVTLLAIGAFLLVRSLSRAEVDIQPEAVDYAAAAEAAREAGFDVVAPANLPAGWTATAVDLDQTDPPLWGMGVLTEEGRFVGLRQEVASVADLVEENIDEEAVEGDPVELDSMLGSTWQTWTDEGGDTGYSIEYGEQNLLVYGSASASDLQDFVGLLER